MKMGQGRCFCPAITSAKAGNRIAQSYRVVFKNFMFFVSFCVCTTHPPALFSGAVAQLEEHLLCKQRVVGSNPSGSTNFRRKRKLPRHSSKSDGGL